MKITADTIIRDTLRMSPRVAEVYRAYNLRCHACLCNESDTIADIAWNYGVDLNALLRDLNAAAEGKAKSDGDG